MIDWNGKRVIAASQMQTDIALYKAAIYAAKVARQKVPVDEGDLKSAIDVKKSKFKNGGYLMGVFDDSGKSFEDSLGAIAVYVEYGHAAPGRGRKGKKVAKEKPFIRPAMKSLKRAQDRFFKDILK